MDVLDVEYVDQLHCEIPLQPPNFIGSSRMHYFQDLSVLQNDWCQLRKHQSCTDLLTVHQVSHKLLLLIENSHFHKT
jgi:hypothetical protein